MLKRTRAKVPRSPAQPNSPAGSIADAGTIDAAADDKEVAVGDFRRCEADKSSPTGNMSRRA